MEIGDETYGTPAILAKAISADLSVELAEATLYADDGAAEVVKEFKSGTLSLNVDDIGSAVAQKLTGAVLDENKVLVSQGENVTSPVAIGFRAKKANGNDYFIFACSGTADFAYRAFKMQIDNMAASPTGYFRMADSEAEGSMAYREKEGYAHDGRAMMEYAYNGLCWFWNDRESH